jgi:hypothetical protein
MLGRDAYRGSIGITVSLVHAKMWPGIAYHSICASRKDQRLFGVSRYVNTPQVGRHDQRQLPLKLLQAPINLPRNLHLPTVLNRQLTRKTRLSPSKHPSQHPARTPRIIIDRLFTHNHQVVLVLLDHGLDGMSHGDGLDHGRFGGGDVDARVGTHSESGADGVDGFGGTDGEGGYGGDEGGFLLA